MRPFLTVLGLGIALGATLSAPVMAQHEEGVAVPPLVDGRLPPAIKAAPAVPWQRFGIDLGRVPEIRLEVIDIAALRREDDTRQNSWRDAVGRKLTVTALDGNWYALPGDLRLWAIDLVAAEAFHLRIHVSELRLPLGAEIALYAPGGERNPFVLRHSTSVAELWTPTFPGERVRVEYLAPPSSGAELPFRLDRLIHGYRDPLDPAPGRSAAKAAGSCNNDVSCHPEWQATANAISRAHVVRNGDGFLCSGQLLNTVKRDRTPYWLGAQHCFGSQQEAATAEFFWFYQTASCGGPAPMIDDVPRALGATLVGSNAATGSALLLIEGAIPAGLTFAGWSSAKPRDGSAAVAIHHPSGDFKRISFGTTHGSCKPNFLRVDWSSGVTEQGSSGSGLFLDNASRQLIGTLSESSSSCSSPTFDCYGAFSTAYKSFKKPLKEGSDDKSEQNDSCRKARLLRPGPLAPLVVKVSDEDWYRLSVPAGKPGSLTLRFTHANGDIDLEGFTSCGGPVVARSTGSGDEETASVVNSSSRPGFVYFRVFLADDVRNTYGLNAALDPTPPPTDSLVRFTNAGTGFSTADVRDVDDQIVRFDTANTMIWAADGTHFPGWPVDGTLLGSDRRFQVRFGTRQGQPGAWFTETEAATICDIQVVGGELRIFPTSTTVPNN